MTSTAHAKRGPNRLLQGMILVSLVIHAVVFMQIAGIYRSKIFQYIDLTIQDISKPFIRAIPRPPLLPKAEDKPADAKAFKMTPIEIPDVNQLGVGPGDVAISSGPMKVVGMPTRQDYYEMVRLRIDRQKKYPEEAKNKEGQVVVSFVIQLDGSIRDLRIEKPCPHKALNEAAIQAVRDSVPFLRPPPRLFNEDVPIELTVKFELL